MDITAKHNHTLIKFLFVRSFVRPTYQLTLGVTRLNIYSDVVLDQLTYLIFFVGVARDELKF